jgi:PAS domain S-box-containing protein
MDSTYTLTDFPSTAVDLKRKLGATGRKIAVIAPTTLVTVVLVVTAVAASLYFPYSQTISRTQTQLADTLNVQTSLLLNLAQSQHELQLPDGVLESQNETLLSLLAVPAILKEYAASTELIVVRKEAGNARLLLKHEKGGINSTKASVNFNGPSESPMQLALLGETGTGIGIDNGGKKVLAAYRWVPELKFGLVAKIPLVEIRRPYFQAVLVNSIAWLFILLTFGCCYTYPMKSTIRKGLGIKQSEYRAIFDTSSDGMIVVDTEYKIRSLNPAAATMFGYWLDEVAGKKMEMLFAESKWKDHNSFIDFILNRKQHASSSNCEVQARRKDGSVFTASILISEMHVNEHPLFTCILRDITQQKEVAQALFEAKEVAETATRAKSQFLANMSHEIRSPLNGITGMLDLFKSTELTPQQTHYRDLAEESAEFLLTIINDILDLSKIESGHLTLEAIAIDLPNLLNQIMELFDQKARKKGLDLQLELADGTPTTIYGDPVRLRQVLINLVDNAIKYTSQGGVKVCVEKIAQKDETFELCFKVADTGCGINENQHGNLFKPYVQSDLSNTRLHGGTGLGLSICHSLIELMGGEFDFTSHLGQGSVFWFSISFKMPDLSNVSASAPVTTDLHTPLADEKPADRMYPVLASQSENIRHNTNTSIPVISSCRRRILVVDDKEVNRILCEEILKQLGFNVVSVDDGKQALDAISKGPFDLVLMDCKMPVMDGYAASKKIRAWENAHNIERIPIIAMTANAMGGARETCLAANMDDHLTKPFRIQHLQSMLANWLPIETPKCIEAA